MFSGGQNCVTIPLIILLFSHVWNFVEALQCYSCYSFKCDEEIGNCKDIKNLAIVNETLDKLTETGHLSQRCSYSTENLNTEKNLSSNYKENCSTDSSSCGSYKIRLTTIITRIRQENETEYPILIPPNFYYSTIVSLGCVKQSPRNDSNLTTPISNTEQCRESSSFLENQTTSYGNLVKINMKFKYNVCNDCHQNLCNYMYLNPSSTPPSTWTDFVNSSHSGPLSLASSFHWTRYGLTSWLYLLILTVFTLQNSI